MRLQLKRWIITKEATLGKLSVDGQFFCYTLEDRIRPPTEKVYGETAIPTGEYTIELTYSPKFKTILPLLKNVPDFDGVRIHAGNTAKDTDGCILVGETYQGMTIGESKKALGRLLSKLAEAKGGINISVS